MQTVSASGRPHSLDVWNLTLNVNLTGTFNLTRVACKHLVTAPEGPDGERGVVVMVASTAAVRCYSARPFSSLPHLLRKCFSLSLRRLKVSLVKLHMPPAKVHSSV